MRKKTVPVLCAAAALLAVGVCACYLRNREQEAEETVSGTGKTADLVWQGKEYNYNEHLSNYLFLGVDNSEKEATATGQANAGQADALYLMSYDRTDGEIAVITIPRDTMTEIEAFGPGGESLGMTEDHISLSYAYGDGGHESCRLAKEAVSNLLYGIPVQGYCSLNLEGIPVLTECVGGVTVTVPNDSLEAVNPELSEGTEVKLDKENTELFVRYRDTGIQQSAMSRMERQQEYIRGFGEALREAYQNNPSVITKLYDSLTPYMVTNMGTDEFLDIAESMDKGGDAESRTVPGEAVSGGQYDEYHVDDESLFEMIIDIFYVEAD